MSPVGVEHHHDAPRRGRRCRPCPCPSQVIPGRSGGSGVSGVAVTSCPRPPCRGRSLPPSRASSPHRRGASLSKHPSEAKDHRQRTAQHSRSHHSEEVHHNGPQPQSLVAILRPDDGHIAAPRGASSWAAPRTSTPSPPRREILAELGVAHEVLVVSAHRTPDWMFEYASTAESRGLEVIIAGAGGAAHLPGMVAAKTVLPVLGVPDPGDAAQRRRLAALSIVQMPKGVPVATLAIGKPGAANAALLAASILGVRDRALRERLRAWRKQRAPDEVMAKRVLAMTVILPGATLGILGGGQLGRMTAMAARPLGFQGPRARPRPVVRGALRGGALPHRGLRRRLRRGRPRAALRGGHAGDREDRPGEHGRRAPLRAGAPGLARCSR
jgi:5-(carboxyamino)imidazole ribonucleotide mutase